MKLKQQAIDFIRDKKIRLRLCQELDMTEQTIMEYIRTNRKNGQLTTYAALKVIRELSGWEDSKILESSDESDTKTNSAIKHKTKRLLAK